MTAPLFTRREIVRGKPQARSLPGEIVEVTGPVYFKIWMADGAVIRAHQDHLWKRPEINELQVEPPFENIGDEFPGEMGPE